MRKFRTRKLYIKGKTGRKGKSRKVKNSRKSNSRKVKRGGEFTPNFLKRFNLNANKTITYCCDTNEYRYGKNTGKFCNPTLSGQCNMFSGEYGDEQRQKFRCFDPEHSNFRDVINEDPRDYYDNNKNKHREVCQYETGMIDKAIIPLRMLDRALSPTEEQNNARVQADAQYKKNVIFEKMHEYENSLIQSINRKEYAEPNYRFNRIYNDYYPGKLNDERSKIIIQQYPIENELYNEYRNLYPKTELQSNNQNPYFSLGINQNI